MLTTANADVYTDFSGLAKLKNQAKQDSPEALKEVAKQFESIFINNMLKGMREAKLADGVMDSDQTKFYNEMYDQQLALQLSKAPGIGLADLIVKQLSHDQPKKDKQDSEDLLNKSGGLTRGAPQAIQAKSQPIARTGIGYEDGDVKISPYTQETDPLNPAAVSLDSGNILPGQDDGVNPGHGRPIQSAEEFVRRLHPYAEQAARELGVEPKAILAQAALETGWGRSVIKNGNGENSYNLFNIKADKSWQGKQVQVASLEFDQGIPRKVSSGFRSYNSFKESFQDYVDFIKSNPRYGEALKKAGNAEQYMHALQRAGYATDPNYADKVMSIYQGNTMAGFEPDVTVAMNQ
ncbi:MAG: flagellar assembly peptidoglycan hydrolase FlgJ [Methylobacter sp.]